MKGKVVGEQGGGNWQLTGVSEQWCLRNYYKEGMFPRACDPKSWTFLALWTKGTTIRGSLGHLVATLPPGLAPRC